MNEIKAAILTLGAIGCALAMNGCAETRDVIGGPVSLAQYKAAGLITKVDVGDIVVTLHCRGLDPMQHINNNDPKSLNAAVNSNVHAPYLGGSFYTHLAAEDAAKQYRAQLHRDFVMVEIKDAAGAFIAAESDGTPAGYHWRQDGIEFTNTAFGPVDIHPTYGLEQE